MAFECKHRPNFGEKERNELLKLISDDEEIRWFEVQFILNDTIHPEIMLLPPNKREVIADFISYGINKYRKRHDL